MESAYDEAQKEAAGKLATIVWIASGIFLYITTESAKLWPTLIFVFVGMLVAALVFGEAHHLLQRGIAKLLMLFIKEPTTHVAIRVQSFGFVVMATETVIIYLVASWAFQRFAA